MTTNPHHEVATPDCAILNLKQQGKCFLVFFRKDKIRGQTIRGSYYSEIFLFGSLLFQLKQFFFFILIILNVGQWLFISPIFKWTVLQNCSNLFLTLWIFLPQISKIRILKLWQIQHCMKSVQIRSFSLFEYRKIRSRNNSIFGHFPRSASESGAWMKWFILICII